MAGQSASKPPSKSRVPLNAVLLSSSQLARTVIGFIFFLFLARRLGPSEYGKYMFAFALSEIFSILGDVGLHEYMIREISRRPQELQRRLAGILTLKTLLSSGSALIMIALLPFLGKDRETSLAVVAFALAQIGYSWFYASTIAYSVRQDLHIQAFLWLAEKALYAAAGFAVLFAGRGFLAVALSNTVVQFLGGGVAVWIVWKKYGPLRLSVDARSWRPYLKGALPFGLIVGFYLVYFRVDSVMISFFRGDDEVGLYGAAYNLVSALMFLPSALVAALFPKLAATYHQATADVDIPFQRAVRWLLAMSLPMAVGGSLLASELTQALLGDRYLASATAFAVLAWTLPVWFTTFLQGNLLTIIERQKAVAAVGGVNMLVNIGLNLAVIPRYGFTGAAVTTLVTEAVGLSLMFYLLRSNISLRKTLSLLLRLGLMAAGMAAVVIVLRGRIHVGAVVGLAGLFYAAVVVIFRGVPVSELTDIIRRRNEPGEALDLQSPSSDR